tara:strand:+ start:235 stop:840 length:606 start_codon:yes stop_codon:yes gene_type:complete
MINIEIFFALILYYFVMYVTPGPNNAMVLTSGLKFGFLRTIPHISGITIGHIIQLILVCFGLGQIFIFFPLIQEILKIVCAIYIIYLGYKILGSINPIKEDGSRPLKIYEAALFQIVNPKAWTISSMAASGFLQIYDQLIVSIIIISITAFIICPISIAPWAIFGTSIRRVVKNMKIKKIIEYILAGFLIVTAFLIVFNDF